jgi:uncharacterized integral membrane protein
MVIDSGDWAHRLRKLGGMFVLLLVAVFCLQNLGMARIEFLHWSFEAPRALIYALIFLAGGLGGLLLRRSRAAAPGRPGANPD